MSDDVQQEPIAVLGMAGRFPAAIAEDVAELAVPAQLADITERLRRIWLAVLGEDVDEDITPDSDFFYLGGNSLTAMELMSTVRAEFGVGMGVEVLFDYFILGELAAQIDRLVG
jgi:phthiocerol/phenolphthiocerol synthesis type-I polyketide synthase E